MPRRFTIVAVVTMVQLVGIVVAQTGSTQPPLDRSFAEVIYPLLRTQCFPCHSGEKPRGKLDLSQYSTLAAVAKNYHVWDRVLERLEAEEMPPEDAPVHPTPHERRTVIEWIRAVREREVRSDSGDPGTVLARRLSNAEFDYTIRDLTGIDMKPTREFPVDPANEAGFDNSGESLSMSPALLKKYLAAARRVADHLVLGPDGFLFAPHPVVTDTDRDKYCVQRIIEFYERHRVDYADYFLAAWQYAHRDAMGRPESTLADFARDGGLSEKYLVTVWSALTEPGPSVGPLDAVRDLWRKLPADVQDSDAARRECIDLRELVVHSRKQLEPTVDKLHVRGISDGSQPLVLWRNRQLADRRMRYCGDAVGDQATALEQFCRVFPDTFYVAARGAYFDPKLGAGQRLLTAGFHLMQGYFRDDAPLYELVLDEAGQRELDSLWQQLNFVTLAPLRQYKDFIFFERAEPPRFMGGAAFDFARSEDKDATSEAKMKRLAEAYLDKAHTMDASDQAIEAMESCSHRNSGQFPTDSGLAFPARAIAPEFCGTTVSRSLTILPVLGLCGTSRLVRSGHARLTYRPSGFRFVNGDSRPLEAPRADQPGNDRMERRPKGPEKPLWRSQYWVLIIVGLLIVVGAHSLLTSQAHVELPYYQLIGEVRAHRISEVKIGQFEITGKWQKQSGEEVVFYTPSRGLEHHANDSLTKLLDENEVGFSGDREPSALQALLLYLIPMVVLVGLFLYMMRRMGGGSAMAFARSRARMYGQEDIDVTFSDVAGIDEAVEELREVVDFLKSPEKYQTLGGRIPKGVLLVGPPGTGKTLLSRAVAGEAGVPFFSLSGSDFVEMFVGVGAARVRDLFQQAEQKAPCIVFIDELDALGKTRGGIPVGGHDEREQTLNQLLVEMDGFESDRGVIIMAATNRPETLDPALLRAGRFDRNVVVDRPDINGREAILKVHTRNVKLGSEVELRSIASLTPGFVGADLASLVNEAALLAARGGKLHVGRAELEAGIERVMAGLEKKARVMLPAEKRRIAVHEAGHAIVAALIPNTDPVHKISIIPRGMAALGYTMQRPQDDRYLATKSQLESEIRVLLGGLGAEDLLLGETSSGAANDLERATATARRMVKNFGMSPRLGPVSFQDSGPVFLPTTGRPPQEQSYSELTAREIDEEIKRILDEALIDVRALLVRRRRAIEELAERLLRKEVIESAELSEVLSQTADVRVDPSTN